MGESNVERVRRGYEAVMRRDLDALAELLDPAVRWHAGDPDAKYACHNKDEALQFMRQNWLRGGSPGELLDVVDAGEKVVVIMRRAPDDRSRRRRLPTSRPSETGRSSRWSITRTRRTP